MGEAGQRFLLTLFLCKNLCRTKTITKDSSSQDIILLPKASLATPSCLFLTYLHQSGPPQGQGGYYPQQPQQSYQGQPYGGPQYAQGGYQPQPPPNPVYV